MPDQTDSTITTDVAIVGGGVAGSSLAAVLTEAGLGVVVVEREPIFRDRVRGEGIHPWGVAEAEKLGLLSVLREAGARELSVWQRYADRLPNEPSRWDETFPGSHGEWSIHHPTLQQALLDEAVKRGARLFRPARVTAFRRSGGPELDVKTDDGERRIRARLVVGADGRTSPARRWVGASTQRDPVHHAMGGALLNDVSLPETSAHQAGYPGGFSMIFPQGGGRARAYLVCRNEQAEELRGPTHAAAFMAACAAPLPDGALTNAILAGPVAFFPNADVWADRIAADGVVLTGDAAGANDPSLGHGLSMVFRDARELRDLLLDGRDWALAIAEFASRRVAYHAALRAHAQWMGMLTTEVGPEADARREQVGRARELDPTAGGWAAIFALGPDGLVPDEAARRHFFGEDVE